MVTANQAKTYLLQVGKLKNQCDALYNQIMELQSRKGLQPVRIRDGGKSSRKRYAGFERTVEDIEDLKDRYYEIMLEFITFQHEIIGKLDKMMDLYDDEDLSVILFYRYVFPEPWSEVEKKLRKCYNTLIRKHRKALEAFGAMFEPEILEWFSEHE